MRDGFELLADVYLPAPDAKNLPCILVRNPWGKSHFRDSYTPLVQHGFAVVIQNTRSVQDPGGSLLPFIDEGWGEHKDGYDTVEWLARNSLTNGRIGTLGFSAMGITQLMLAATAPPHLVCQYIGMAAPDLFHYAIYPDGRLLKNQVEGWLKMVSRHAEVFKMIQRNSQYNEFWEQTNSQKMAEHVRVPGLFYSGWYDTFSQGTIDAFLKRQKDGGPGAKGHQKLVMGPWQHHWPYLSVFGDFEVPVNAKKMPEKYSSLEWFIYYLKGQDNSVPELPAVAYYVMGPFDGSPSKGNVWRYAENWPVPSQPTPLYLDQQGVLSFNKPSQQQKTAFNYDPANPSPTLGGRNLFLPSGPEDQSSLQRRADLAIFTSDALSQDLEVTGRLYAMIQFQSNVPETDLSIRLCDVYPDGRSVLIADSLKKVSQAAHKQTVELDLWSTSIVFAKGHKIRIYVSGANYPKYEKSLNGGQNDAKAPIAHDTIFMGPDDLSFILLPVVPSKADDGKNGSSGYLENGENGEDGKRGKKGQSGSHGGNGGSSVFGNGGNGGNGGDAD